MSLIANNARDRNKISRQTIVSSLLATKVTGETPSTAEEESIDEDDCDCSWLNENDGDEDVGDNTSLLEDVAMVI